MLKRILFFSTINIFMLLVNFACSSSEDTKNENTIPQDSLKQSQYIPPRTADIKAEIISFIEEKDNLICILKIEEVFFYGAGMTPLPPGTEIETYISKSLIENESKKINEKEKLFARISQVNAIGNKEYWEIKKFNK